MHLRPISRAPVRAPPPLRALSSFVPLVCVLATLGGCASGGSGGEDDDESQKRLGPVALERFQQDRYAIGAKWYQYAPDGHVLTPYPDAYLLRIGTGGETRYAAMRVVSYYDPDTASSGRFTLGLATWDGAAWSDEEEWRTPRDVKTSGPLCVDVLAREERSCDDDAWHVSLRTFSSLSTLSQIVVNNAGLFPRSHAGDDGGVHIAKLAGHEDLSSLPSPLEVQALDDGPCPSWESTDWDFSRWAPSLPERGMLLGRRFTGDGFEGRDDVYFLVNGRFTLARFTVHPKVPGDPTAGLSFTYSTMPIDRNDLSIGTADVEVHTVEVDAPPVGEAAFLSFDSETGDLLADPSRVGDANWPHQPPPGLFWDLAVERVDDALRLVLSPASGLFNATALGEDGGAPFEDTWPPVLAE